jgi:hypothetical protein
MKERKEDLVERNKEEAAADRRRRGRSRVPSPAPSPRVKRRLDQTGKADVEIARKAIERVLQTDGKELATRLENAADMKYYSSCRK